MITNHTILVTVDGVDKTSYLLKGSLFVRLSIKNKNDTAELRFREFIPTEGSEIEISVDGTKIFGGLIVSKTSEVIGVKPDKIVFTSVECRSWVILLEKSTVDTSYVQKSDSYIVNDLFTNYSTGFDASTYVNQLDNDLDITFTQITLRQALDNLAVTVGADWYINPNKELLWFKPSEPSLAAFNIDCDNPNDSTTFDVLNNSLKLTTDANNIINRVIVSKGTTTVNEKVTENLTAGNSDTVGPLSDYADTIFYIHYYDISDNEYSVFGSFVGYAPQDKLRKEGGAFNAILSEDRKSIRLQGNSGELIKPGSTVTVDYYKKQSINVTVDDTNSQNVYGIYPTTILNQNFANEDEAEKLAQAILAENAFGKQTLNFEITRYGLLPGTLIRVNVSELEIGDQVTRYLLMEDGSYLLLENGDKILLESSNEPQAYLIQEVSYIPVVTQSNKFMLVAQVVCGKYQKDIIDSLSKIGELQSAGSSTLTPNTSKLSNISNNLGDVILGKAVFTDGGTASFNWGTPNGASGVVVGLDDRDNSYGAMLVLDAGTTKAKIGRLNDLGTVFGTVIPSGWGIYTDNGYFSGTVAASKIIGGTISGNYITGGTVTGSLISGGTISGTYVTGLTIVGGTIATSTPPINSSNPGVIMDSTGLYGYGSAGLTFRLSSNPAIKPYFSSGTITEAVYEISTQAVIRTSATNPKVQIDNSGIFAYNSAGSLKFTVDAATGKMTAVDGAFSGTVSASTLTGNIISGGTITGSRINGGTVSGGVFTGGTVSGGTVSAAYFNGGTITSVAFSGNTITGGTISGSYISGGTIISGTYSGTVQVGVNSSNPLIFVTSLGTVVQKFDDLGVYVHNLLPNQVGVTQLGGVTKGFNSLFIKSSNGTTYRIGVDAGGALVCNPV